MLVIIVVGIILTGGGIRLGLGYVIVVVGGVVLVFVVLIVGLGGKLLVFLVFLIVVIVCLGIILTRVGCGRISGGGGRGRWCISIIEVGTTNPGPHLKRGDPLFMTGCFSFVGNIESGPLFASHAPTCGKGHKIIPSSIAIRGLEENDGTSGAGGRGVGNRVFIVDFHALTKLEGELNIIGRDPTGQEGV